MFKEGIYILKCLWQPGGPEQSLDAAVVDGGKGTLFSFSILLISRCSLGAPAPLIQSANSL